MSTGAMTAGRAAAEALVRGKRPEDERQPKPKPSGPSSLNPRDAVNRLRAGQGELRAQHGDADGAVRAARIRANAARLALQQANAAGDPQAIAAAGSAFGAARSAAAEQEGAFGDARTRLAENHRARSRILAAQRTEDEANQLSNERGAFVSPQDVLAERQMRLKAQFGPALERSAAQTDASADLLTDRRTQLQGGPEAVAAQSLGQAPVVNPLIDERIAGEAVRRREVAAADRARAAMGLELAPPAPFQGVDDRLGDARGALDTAGTAISEGEARAERMRQRAELQRQLEELNPRIALAQGEAVIRDASGGGAASLEDQIIQSQLRGGLAQAQTDAARAEKMARFQNTPRLKDTAGRMVVSIGQLAGGEPGNPEQRSEFDAALSVFESLSPEDQSIVREQVLSSLRELDPDAAVPAGEPGILDRFMGIASGGGGFGALGARARQLLFGTGPLADDRRTEVNQFLRGG